MVVESRYHHDAERVVVVTQLLLLQYIVVVDTAITMVNRPLILYSYHVLTHDHFLQLNIALQCYDIISSINHCVIKHQLNSVLVHST